jgi:hypothetical protein
LGISLYYLFNYWRAWRVDFPYVLLILGVAPPLAFVVFYKVFREKIKLKYRLLYASYNILNTLQLLSLFLMDEINEKTPSAGSALLIVINQKIPRHNCWFLFLTMNLWLFSFFRTRIWTGYRAMTPTGYYR